MTPATSIRSGVCLFVAWLVHAAAASALVAPGLRWDILPSSTLPTPPASESAEAASGPIGASVANGNTTGLTHFGVVEVNYGRADVFNEIERVLSIGAGFGYCSPAPCGQSLGRWLDAITITAPGVANGTPGSFEATIVVDAALEAYVPPGWNFTSALVTSRYAVFVSVDGVMRDQINPACFAWPTPPCSVSGANRRYFPEDYPTTPAQTTPLGGLSGTFPVGPYDFVYGEPFELDVQAVANTSVGRGINETGDPYATSALSLDWGGFVAVHDAAGLGGNAIPLANVHVATASGTDWVSAPEPGALTPVAIAALGALGFARRRAYPARPCSAQRIDRGSAARS